MVYFVGVCLLVAASIEYSIAKNEIEIEDFPINFNRLKLEYDNNACEENMWNLAKKIQEIARQDLEYCSVVFISNKDKSVPLWQQKGGIFYIGHRKDWTYHAILVYSKNQNTFVYDFNSRLKCPTEFNTYSKETFKRDEDVLPSEHRFFRVVPAVSFLKYFSKYVQKSKGKGYFIQGEEDKDVQNVENYISMKEDPSLAYKYGKVYTLQKFVELFQNVEV